MYLKSIEVHGFKSFANKIKFDFHNGITGIVGPNGSGKSNVADAVRWVLGEQRVKQLRGASMQDVIFSGTENRKPQSYASVSITLDNSDHQLTIDYDEVTITRRVYRSGESEYLLNGTACRLKDVNELFYDTGIGKEGYSIIGQGQIDRILSGKPEERRELFDEAAGIVKFKRRKSAAEKRLESEHANLLRVNDILSEVEKQLGPLERQSEVAKQFLKKRSELEENEIQSFLLEMDRIQQQLGSVEEKALIAQQDLNETNQQFESIREEYDKMEQELSLLEDGITLTRDKMNETSLLKGKLEGQIGVLQEQIKSANLNDAQYVERIASLNTQKDESFLQQSQYQNSKEEIQTFLNKVSSEQQQATARLLEIQQEILQYNQKIEQGKNEIMELLNNKASMKGKQQKYDTLLEQTNIRKAQLNQRLLQKHSDEEQMLTDLLEQESRLNQIEEQLLDQHAKAQDCESKTKEWNDKFQDTNRKLEQMSIAFHREQSRYESLINIAERYDGYTNSIRKVMEKKEEEVGLVGVVADIIKVDKKYEQAIETALGGNIQNIVTTDEQTAKNMIQYLKEQKLGRATFLPLTTVTPKEDEKTQQALMEPGVIGRADSLILTDEKFRGVMEFLLCRVIVVDHIDSGLKLAKKYQYGLRIVTLEGESLNYGGSLTGGSFKNNSNLLGRGREIAQLEAGIKEKEQGIVEARNRLEEIQTAKEFLKKDKEDLRDQIAELEMEKRTIALALDRTRNQKDESDLLYANLALENQEIEVQIREIKNSKEQVRLDMEGAKSRNETITKQIEQWKEALEERIYLEEEQGKRVSSLQMEEASCSQKNGFMQENLDRILGEIKRLDGEIQAITE
ncbi:MAG: chromosome segregation protein SMC, partial [Lachnospiraceae bacterium]|nr:chromosome segregation protein SMC [Lachnospiraceae bacterium]